MNANAQEELTRGMPLLTVAAQDLQPHDIFEAGGDLVLSVDPVEGDPDAVLVHYEMDGVRASYSTLAATKFMIRRRR